MSFENIFGNDEIKNLLETSIKSGNLVHSYMFVGNSGIGKKLFATEFAKIILCENNDEACDTCSSCVKFNSGNHPDFTIIDSEDGKNIKIEQVRNLQEQIAEKPIISNKKVYIINNSDLMTTEAQNCLLKTLEEPPEYAVLILVLSNESKLLNTIKSRCTKISFKNLSKEELSNYAKLNNMQISENMLDICDGSISKLLSLGKNTEFYNNIDKTMDDLASKDIVEVWNGAEFLYKAKEDILEALDYFNIVLLKKLKHTNEPKYINAVNTVELTKKRLNTNANYDMCIDNLLLKIWEAFHESNSRS